MLSLHKRSSSGFTLIELLVVVAIIVVLIAILLPSLGRARDQAKASACLSKMHQLGLTISMYTQEWDGTLPYIKDANFSNSQGGNTWTFIYPGYPTWLTDYYGFVDYRKSLAYCESYVPMSFMPGVRATGNIGLNYGLFRFSNFTKPFRKYSYVTSPANTLFASDIWDPTNPYNNMTPGGTSAVTQYCLGGDNPEGAHFRHAGKLNVLWGDYHAGPFSGPMPAKTDVLWTGNMK